MRRSSCQWRLALILFLLGGVLRSNPAVAESDFAYSPEVVLTGPVGDDVQWIASLEPKITSDAQQASEISLVGGLCWKPVDYLAVIPQFKYITKGVDDCSNELRPRIAMELTGKAGVYKVALRNRLEYRMKEDQDEYWRYRGRIKLKFPKVGTISPFIYDEVFYEFGDKDELNGNEMGFGGGLPLGDKLSLCLDVRLCHSRSEEKWGTGNISFLTTFKYSF
ncbi:MAG: DUF2490 domain-containing protein [Kiritimatiellae bacterium]|nr:DUF2490 domain-containing protein [Kiritimatiellia bacterium]